jgi:DNA-binding MarR family transcriptional regulator
MRDFPNLRPQFPAEKTTCASKSKNGTVMTRKAIEADLGQSPLHLFHRAVQVVTEIYQAEMSNHDLTARQYAVLFALAHSDGMSQSELVDATGIDRSTMADIVRRMLKKNIVQRKRDKDDARAYEVKITDEGARLFKQVTPIVHRIEEKLLSSLKGKRTDEFLDSLGMIVGTVSPAGSPASNGHYAEADLRK